MYRSRNDLTLDGTLRIHLIGISSLFMGNYYNYEKLIQEVIFIFEG